MEEKESQYVACSRRKGRGKIHRDVCTKQVGNSPEECAKARPCCSIYQELITAQEAEQYKARMEEASSDIQRSAPKVFCVDPDLLERIANSYSADRIGNVSGPGKSRVRKPVSFDDRSYIAVGMDGTRTSIRAVEVVLRDDWTSETFDYTEKASREEYEDRLEGGGFYWGMVVNEGRYVLGNEVTFESRDRAEEEGTVSTQVEIESKPTISDNGTFLVHSKAPGPIVHLSKAEGQTLCGHRGMFDRIEPADDQKLCRRCEKLQATA